jgi:glutamate-ammonia-ligase adenylyltransferase
MKRARGGLIDIEFAAQGLQIVHAPAGGPLSVHTGEALAALRAAGLAPEAAARDLEAAWTLQQYLSQVLKVALPDAGDPSQEPEALRALLARAGGVDSFAALTTALKAARAAARKAYEGVLK